MLKFFTIRINTKNEINQKSDIKMNTSFENWNQQFESEEKEFLILTSFRCGAGLRQDYAVVYHKLIGYINLETNSLFKDNSVIWPISTTEFQNREFFNRLEKQTIYRIKGKLYDHNREKNNQKISDNIYLTEILEENVENEELKRLLDEYNTIVSINDDVLGELTLNKEFNFLEATVDWLGREVTIDIEVFDEDQQSWYKYIDTMKSFVIQQQQWDHDMKKFSCDTLLELANEWADEIHEEGQEASNQSQITENEFMNRISLSSLSLSYDEDEDDYSFSAYYDDDDIFLGHSIEIFLSLKNGITNAHLAG